MRVIVRAVRWVSGHPRVAALLALMLVTLSGYRMRRATLDVPSAVVRRGPFLEQLVETGTISAQRLMLYSSTIAGAQAKIAELVAEGRLVGPGDVLIRFDTTAFEQTRARERAALGEAEAELVRAREAQRLERLAAEATVDQATQQVSFAQSGLANQLEGRGPVQLAEAEAALSESTRELIRVRKDYEDLQPLLSRGFITRAELDRAAQNLEHAEEQHRIAEARRDALVRYEQPAARGRAQAELHAAQQAVTRESEAAAARARDRRAAVSALEGRVAEIRARIAILDGQIGRAVVRSSGSGLVVYRDLFFGSDRRKPQVGDEVWPNQPLIALPDSSQLVVETRVREIDLHKMASSQRVEIRVDAYPDLVLAASVGLIGALAQEDPTRAGTKFFPVTIRLHQTDDRLRTGMTARVQIDVRSLPDATLVPIEAIRGERGAWTVQVLRGSTWESRPVAVVAENENEAAVSGNLTAGERVALVDPAALSRH